MIAWLTGSLLEKSASSIVLNVNGVGYDVAISMTTFLCLPEEGAQYACFIHTVVREDAIALFGFNQREERSLFQSLIKVSGIGPKVALNILSSVNAEAFNLIIQTKDSKQLVKLPGIGKKTAERLIIELQDKLPNVDIKPNSTQATSMSSARYEAIQALIALGYQTKQAEGVITSIDDSEMGADGLIRSALRSLSPV